MFLIYYVGLLLYSKITMCKLCYSGNFITYYHGLTLQINIPWCCVLFFKKKKTSLFFILIRNKSYLDNIKCVVADLRIYIQH